jgi:hypothetical protein
MKFHELSVNDRFVFNGKEYIKIPEVKVSCCKIRENCKDNSSGTTAVLRPNDEVEKVA